MPNYAIYHSVTGEIHRTVDVPPEFIADQVGEGESFLECDAEPQDMIDLATGELIRVPALDFPQDMRPEYMKVREQIYPPVAEQLDMLFHAMDLGEIPKATDWFNTIQRIKDAVPKDGQTTPVVIYGVDEIPPEDAEE